MQRRSGAEAEANAEAVSLLAAGTAAEVVILLAAVRPAAEAATGHSPAIVSRTFVGSNATKTIGRFYICTLVVHPEKNVRHASGSHRPSGPCLLS